MGTGKSTAGRVLAEKMGVRFVDVDEEIEKRSGKKISDIFREDGEQSFRKIEREEIAKACALDGAVIAAGGGAVLDERNWAEFRKKSVVVCLSASEDEIVRRLQKESETRPLLGSNSLQQRVHSLLRDRKVFYAKADHTIDTTGKNPEGIAKEIEEIMKRFP